MKLSPSGPSKGPRSARDQSSSLLQMAATQPYSYDPVAAGVVMGNDGRGSATVEAIGFADLDRSRRLSSLLFLVLVPYMKGKVILRMFVHECSFSSSV